MGHTFGKISNIVMGVKMNVVPPQVSARGSKSVVFAGGQRNLSTKVSDDLFLFILKDGKQSACNGETQVRSLGGEDPQETEMATPCSILAWKSQAQRSLAGYSPRGGKELDMTELLTFSHFHSFIFGCAGLLLLPVDFL